MTASVFIVLASAIVCTASLESAPSSLSTCGACGPDIIAVSKDKRGRVKFTVRHSGENSEWTTSHQLQINGREIVGCTLGIGDERKQCGARVSHKIETCDPSKVGTTEPM